MEKKWESWQDMREKFETKEEELKPIMYVSVQVGEGSSSFDKWVNGSQMQSWVLKWSYGYYLTS